MLFLGFEPGVIRGTFEVTWGNFKVYSGACGITFLTCTYLRNFVMNKLERPFHHTGGMEGELKLLGYTINKICFSRGSQNTKSTKNCVTNRTCPITL